MTLTQAALLTRRTILTLGVLSLLIVFTTVGSSFYQRYQLAQLPPVEEKPQSLFGSLPPPSFPPSDVSSSNYSYSIDTNTGELPQTERFIKVYFIPQAGLTLLAPDRARELAEKLGFSIGPQTETPNTYNFSNETGGRLTINILTGNFSYQKTATPSAQVNPLPERANFISLFKNYLASKVTLPKELTSGRDNVVDNIVTIWPEDIDGLKVITADYSSGLIKGRAVVSDDGQLDFDELIYTFWPVDLTSSSTYLLKTPLEALDEMKNGSGFIAKKPSSPQVSITSVTLAYYQTESYTPYLQPVYVFEGPSFVGLVPAIKL